MSFKLRILYTGGTIGSVDQPLAPLSGRDFCRAFTTLVEPTILERFPGASVSHDWLEPTLDSTNLQPSDWCEIARRIIGAPATRASMRIMMPFSSCMAPTRWPGARLPCPSC